MLLLHCIICGTDNGRGEDFNDFPYRNKFVIYIYISVPSRETRNSRQGSLQTRYSPLSGAHVNGLLMSPYVLYRFAFNFSYCVYSYCMTCTFRIALIIVRLLLYANLPLCQLDVENYIQLLRFRCNFFCLVIRFVILLIYLYCSGKHSKVVFGYF